MIYLPHQSVTIWIVETPQILAWPIRVRVALAPTFVLSSILIVWNPPLPSITVGKPDEILLLFIAPAANVLDQFSNTTFVVAPTLTLASLYPITGATVRPALKPNHFYSNSRQLISCLLSRWLSFLRWVMEPSAWRTIQGSRSPSTPLQGCSL